MRILFAKLNRTDIILIVVMVLLLFAAIAATLFGRLGAVHSYDDCVRAGNPVQMSYPSVCVTSDGQRFVNPDERVTLPTGPLPL